MTDQLRTPLETRTAASGSAEDRNIVDLVGRLTQQGAHLARAQVSLMQAEVREAVNEVKAAIGAMVAAAVFGIAGLGVLLMGIAYFVGDALDDVGLGTTLVGIATLLVAFMLYLSGRKKVGAANLKPDRTIDTLADAPAAASGDIHHTGARS